MTDHDADLIALEARAISAEAKIDAARSTLEAAIADDGAMLSPIVLSDAVMKALEALGGPRG